MIRDERQKISHGRMKRQKQKISHGITHTSFRAGSNTHPLGAKSKGSNGVVAVGLPHRNYSVFKQAHVN